MGDRIIGYQQPHLTAQVIDVELMALLLEAPDTNEVVSEWHREILGQAMIRGFELAGGSVELHEGEVEDLDEVDENGVVHVFRWGSPDGADYEDEYDEPTGEDE